MRDPIPKGPFDQGLFLIHFNKGRDHYEARNYVEAERELEEAYLLRPREPRVLNLLGLAYFKQEKFVKAEEVYRKLVAESPEAHTLHYNLGLICFKLGRLEDAETSFLKALEISKENPKINFYLGSIYERMHRYADAIFQYRQAGANLMVRRVEDKIAATGSTLPPSPRARRKDDTAELPAKAVQEGVRRKVDEALARSDQALFAAKQVQPLSSALLADRAPAKLTDTARFRLREKTLPPVAPAAPTETPKRTPTEQTEPALRRGPEIFRFLDNNLMEIDFSGKVYIKQGTIYSYSGNLTFWVKERRTGGRPALVIVTGTGKLILTDKDREITFMQVADEEIFVEPAHLLACEEALNPRYVPLATEVPATPEVLALTGRGMVALSVASKPLPLAISPGLPVSVPAASVITWSGAVSPRLVDDPEIYEVMLPQGAPSGSLLRLEGTGRVLVEQAV
jgi:tetratricopeptide (TPR) repeat protein